MASVRARPMRSPMTPKISPPVAQPRTKMLVIYWPQCWTERWRMSAGVLGERREERAGWRAMTKTCWPRQSKSQAREASTKTSFW